MITVSDAVLSLRPGAEWSMTGNDVESIVWHTQGVQPLTTAEVEAEIARLAAIEEAELPRKLRQAAFEAESDPLFFEWQRGEGNEQAWLDKVAEIRARYPDPA